jgi:hypothetical protein
MREFHHIAQLDGMVCNRVQYNSNGWIYVYIS